MNHEVLIKNLNDALDLISDDSADNREARGIIANTIRSLKLDLERILSELAKESAELEEWNRQAKQAARQAVPTAADYLAHDAQGERI